MEPYETHLALATALGVGLLVGLEREQTKTERAGSQIGGVRTYPIFAVVGALSTLLAPLSVWLPIAALLGVFGLVAVSYAADVKREADHGMTTEISVVAVYLLGALAPARAVLPSATDRFLLVAALGVALTFVLSSKQFFHSFARRISRADFYASVEFLIVAVIVLPLLPNEDVGPLGAINPRTLGLLVVMISGLSFLGYVAVKLLGAERGLLLGAAAGGLVSSTAATLSYANRTKAQPELAPVAAGAIAIAWTIMLGRVGVVVAVLEPSLLRALALPLGLLIGATLLGLALTFRRVENGGGELQVSNPFELGSAIKVTLLFGVVLLVTKAATEYLGTQGLYLVSAVSGTTDVDAVVLSSIKLSRGTIEHSTAVIAMVIAIGMNTIVKGILAGTIGGRELGKRMVLTTALIVAAAGVSIAVTALA